MMNYPPWATWNQQTPKVRTAPLTIPPYLQYYNNGVSPTAPFRPQGLGSFIPSVQSYNRGTPSEQQGYEGYLSDELGIHPQDVGWLMQRLAPHAYQRGPKWASAANP